MHVVALNCGRQCNCNDQTINSGRMCPTTRFQRIDTRKVASKLYFIAHKYMVIAFVSTIKLYWFGLSQTGAEASIRF